jgi:hypothetical protein
MIYNKKEFGDMMDNNLYKVLKEKRSAELRCVLLIFLVLFIYVVVGILILYLLNKF